MTSVKYSHQYLQATLYFLILLIGFGCGHADKKLNGQWKTIEIGDYLFDFPPDFELISKKGYDSYVGEIKGDSMSFTFDYGYYSYNLEETPEEYLKNGMWRNEILNYVQEKNNQYDPSYHPYVEVMSIRPATDKDSIMGNNCDYIAICKIDTFIFDYAVYMPYEIKQTNYTIDTINNLYRKIARAKDSKKGITGIYIREVDGFDKTMNSYLSLSMITKNITSKQQDLTLKIFNTGRHISKKK